MTTGNKKVQDSQETDPNVAADFLINWFGHVSGFPIQDVPFSHMWKVVRDAEGSSGCDGWAAGELKHLPLGAIETWHKLAGRWLQAGTVPTQLTQVRQVNLPKAHKIESNGCLHVSGMRPISVLSAFWRIWASAWITSKEIQNWITNHKHPAITHGPKSLGSEAGVSVLQDSFVRAPGFICSLDYQEAYDRMDPSIARKFLTSIGWPIGFTEVVFAVWGQQQRFIQFEQHTHSETLWATKSTPQGCPCAPAILALWLSSGVRYVENMVGNLSPSHLVVYVDDRSFVARHWATIEQFIQSWQDFSSHVGLKESRAKTQVAARGRQKRRELASKCDPANVCF